jgi:hypothetical protein
MKVIGKKRANFRSETQAVFQVQAPTEESVLQRSSFAMPEFEPLDMD